MYSNFYIDFELISIVGCHFLPRLYQAIKKHFESTTQSVCFFTFVNLHSA